MHFNARACYTQTGGVYTRARKVTCARVGCIKMQLLNVVVWSPPIEAYTKKTFDYTTQWILWKKTDSRWQEGTKSSGRTVSAAASTTAACVSTDKYGYFSLSLTRTQMLLRYEPCRSAILRLCQLWAARTNIERPKIQERVTSKVYIMCLCLAPACSDSIVQWCTCWLACLRCTAIATQIRRAVCVYCAQCSKLTTSITVVFVTVRWTTGFFMQKLVYAVKNS